MANNQKEQINDITKRRNGLLESLFTECNLPIRMVGDLQKPTFVYDEIAFLSMYVRNFDLHFLLEPGGSVEVARIKLKKQHEMTHDSFMDIISKSTHKALFKVKIKACYLCVSGYNFIDRERSEGRYPVFSRFGHKVYFSKEYTDQLVSELNADNYEVETYIPMDYTEHNLNIELHD